MTFQIFFQYEKSKNSYFRSGKNILIIAFIILKQILIHKKSIYLVKFGSKNIFINELEQLNKTGIIRKVSEVPFDLLYMNKITYPSSKLVNYKYKYRPIKLISTLMKECRENNHTLSVALSVLRSSIKYSFMYDKNFSFDLKEILQGYKISFVSDPGNPFIRMIVSLHENETKYVCTTLIGPHSVEWENIPEKKIYVVGNAKLAQSFHQIFGKNVKYVNSQAQKIAQQKYKFKILFLQQYYHNLAFKGRCTHFILNCKIGMKKGVLMRLHPSESVLERRLYQILSYSNLVKLSNDTLERDFQQCKFAVSFSSSALLDFKILTGRSAKFLVSKHQVWSNK